jgi:hypothetical protein
VKIYFLIFLLYNFSNEPAKESEINLDVKKEIISKRESGKSVGDLSAE